MSAPRVLVAGCGNVFLGDDGFGVEVARRLGQLDDLPDGVVVRDAGIRGVHLAYELLDGWDQVILVDAAPRGDAPGTLYILEPDGDVPGDVALFDAHGMQPDAVLATVRALGGEVRNVLVVGCEPADVTEGMGLSPAVSAMVDEAVGMVRELVGRT